MCKNALYVLSAALVMAVVVMIFFPMMGIAGSLEPSASPGPTMKTLDQIPPTWSQTLPATQRFELVFGGAGVLDKETGLVWEQSPSASTFDWVSAHLHCNGITATRRGWRLPTLQELASLVDPTQSEPALPSGHPFGNIQRGCYHTATSNVSTTTWDWVVCFPDGSIDNSGVKTGYRFVWCVRGGQGLDTQ